MLKLKIFLLILFLIPSALFAGEFSLALEGNVSADLYQADYFTGLSPMYCLHFPENRELLIAVPLTCSGEVIYRQNFLQHTQFIAAGLDVSWYEKLFAGKKTAVYWGPEAYYSYGFRPVTWQTIDGITTTEYYSSYFLHSGGLTWPVRLDYRFAKKWELRVTERLLGVQLDSRYVKGYESTIQFNAGLMPTLSPVVAIVAFL